MWCHILKKCNRIFWRKFISKQLFSLIFTPFFGSFWRNEQFLFFFGECCFHRKKLFTRSQTCTICSPSYRQSAKKIKKFKGGLFEKIHFRNFQKNRRHFLKIKNFDIFLGSFDRAKNSSLHERKTNWNSVKKLHHFGKYFGSFYEIGRLCSTAHHPWKKKLSRTVKYVFLHFKCTITYFHAKILWQLYGDLIAWFEVYSVYKQFWSSSSEWLAVIRSKNFAQHGLCNEIHLCPYYEAANLESESKQMYPIRKVTKNSHVKWNVKIVESRNLS